MVDMPTYRALCDRFLELEGKMQDMVPRSRIAAIEAEKAQVEQTLKDVQKYGHAEITRLMDENKQLLASLKKTVECRVDERDAAKITEAVELINHFNALHAAAWSLHEAFNNRNETTTLQVWNDRMKAADKALQKELGPK